VRKNGNFGRDKKESVEMADKDAIAAGMTINLLFLAATGASSQAANRGFLLSQAE
jgi:hypothetical protein